MKKYSGGKILHFLLNCIDIFLALGAFIGVMLLCIGSTKHRLGLEVTGIVITVICCLLAYCLFRG